MTIQWIFEKYLFISNSCNEFFNLSVGWWSKLQCTQISSRSNNTLLPWHVLKWYGRKQTKKHNTSRIWFNVRNYYIILSVFEREPSGLQRIYCLWFLKMIIFEKALRNINLQINFSSWPKECRRLISWF